MKRQNAADVINVGVKNNVTTTSSDAPSPFVAQHAADVIGVLSGFDRLRLMASLRYLYQPSFMRVYLKRVGVLLKDFAGGDGFFTGGNRGNGG